MQEQNQSWQPFFYFFDRFSGTSKTGETWRKNKKAEASVASAF
jgi:hypothetical protein